MRRALYAPRFLRAAAKWRRRHPDLNQRLVDTVGQLRADPSHPSLHSHRLRGELEGLWACAVAYDCRLVYENTTDPQTGEEIIVLIDIGTHDEVYR